MKLNYLNPDVPPELPWHEVEVIKATLENLMGCDKRVEPDEYQNYTMEIVHWPKPECRPIDEGNGNEAGTVSGNSTFNWEGDVFKGTKEAVNSEYVFGWSKNPKDAPETSTEKLVGLACETISAV